MDRNIVYPGSIPLDTDILNLNRNAMTGIAALTAAALGSGTIVDGLACTATSPASLTVNVAAGSITQLTAMDANAYGSLGIDTADQIVKTGINLQPTSFTLTPPAASGNSINYLIEAAFSETDADAVVLPYVDAANPSLPYSGPGNSGAAQKHAAHPARATATEAGCPRHPPGSQATPAVDVGWVGLYVITVNYGQVAIHNGAISTYVGAPFLGYKLPSLRPGFSTVQVFNASGTFIVPNGVTMLRANVIGGGGGAGYHSTMPGGGGGAGGSAVGIVTGLTPGQSIPVTVGAGGAGLPTPANGNNGQTSSFGSYVAATGGVGVGAAPRHSSRWRVVLVATASADSIILAARWGPIPSWLPAGAGMAVVRASARVLAARRTASRPPAMAVAAVAAAVRPAVAPSAPRAAPAPSASSSSNIERLCP